MPFCKSNSIIQYFEMQQFLIHIRPAQSKENGNTDHRKYAAGRKSKFLKQIPEC